MIFVPESRILHGGKGCFCLFARLFRRPRRSVLTVLFLLQAAVCAGNCAVLARATEVFYLEAPAGFYLTALLCCAAAPLWLLFQLWKRPPRSSSSPSGGPCP